ncbi:MAG: cytochrome c family protein [Rhodospirillales bacterium]|nr:cytochrome c family protein [Rhodospirillales bacterium]
MQFTMFQKIGLSVLIFAWLVFGSNFLADKLFTIENTPMETAATETMQEPVAKVTEDVVEEAVVEAVEATVVEAVASGTNGLNALLASADMDFGVKMFKKCKACHTVDKGGKNKVGPNLWNIIDRAQGGVEGFKYSSPMSALSGTWSLEELNTFLTSPSAYVKGTKMMFKGVGDDEDRAALLLYLNQQSDSPIALP